MRVVEVELERDGEPLLVAEVPAEGEWMPLGEARRVAEGA